MTYLLIAFLVVAVAPLLIATWRTSLLALGLQGLLLTAMFLQRGWPTTASGAVLLLDLVVLRTWFVPRTLHGILRGQNAPRRNDVIPANLLSWAVAATLVFVAFRFAARVCPEGGEAATHVAVATAALLLGFLVLATQRRTFGQVVGALRLENAIALFELSGGHALPLAVQLGVTGVLVLTVLTFGAFVRRLGAAPAPSPARAPGGAP
jgi:hydrogenase-4 component E